MTPEKLSVLTQPYFRLKLNFYTNKNEDLETYSEILDICAKLDIDPELYLKGVFYKTWGEQFYRKRYYPKTLKTNWAIKKFSYWYTLSQNDELCATNIEKKFILNSHHYIKSNEDFFTEKNGLIPACITDFKDWNVALSYCVRQPDFWKMYNSLDPDIKEIYFYTSELFALKDAVNKTPEILTYINNKGD